MNSDPKQTLDYARPGKHSDLPQSTLIRSRLFLGVASLLLAIFVGRTAVEVSDSSVDQNPFLRALEPFPGAYAITCALLNAVGLALLYFAGTPRHSALHPIRWTSFSIGFLGLYGALLLYYASSIRYAFGHLEPFINAFASIVSLVSVCLMAYGLIPRTINP